MQQMAKVGSARLVGRIPGERKADRRPVDVNRPPPLPKQQWLMSLFKATPIELQQQHAAAAAAASSVA
jgi:hypothetical protein